nr:RDD family protein [Acidiferrobacterales bacterium]
MESSQYQLIDHVYSVETPEGIQMHAELAGVIPRAAAFVLDLMIRLVVLAGIALASAFLGQVGGGLILISWFVIEWGYPVFFEVLNKGQTPGKKKMQLIVMQDDLTPVTWRTSALRNLLRAVDMLPIGYLFGAASMIFSRNFQRLGDLVA